MLELLRINATTHVLNWVPEVEAEALTAVEHPVDRLSSAYLRSACETVRRRSGNSTFERDLI